MTGWTPPKTWSVREVLTAAGLNTHLRDNSLHLKEGLQTAPNYVKNSVTGGTYTIASGTFADVAGGLNIAAFTPRSASSLIMIALSCTVSTNLASADNLSIDINIDGTRVGDTTYGSFMVQSSAATDRANLFLPYFTALSAVAHTIKPMWRRDGSSTWTLGTTIGQYAHFFVVEYGPLSP